MAVGLRNRRSQVRILSGALENPGECWGFAGLTFGLEIEGQVVEDPVFKRPARPGLIFWRLSWRRLRRSRLGRGCRELVARAGDVGAFRAGPRVAQPMSLAMSWPVARAAELRALSHVARTTSSPSRCRAHARWTASSPRRACSVARSPAWRASGSSIATMRSWAWRSSSVATALTWVGSSMRRARVAAASAARASG